jgi:hypothetical protein
MRQLSGKSCAAVFIILVTATAGEAQIHRAPKIEISAHLGLWSMMDGGGELGARVTRNKNDWLALEYGVTYRPGTETNAPSGLSLVNLRLGLRPPSEPGLGFITVGLVAGRSANYSISPMIGAGVILTPRDRNSRRRDADGGIRFEVQVFPRGKTLIDHGRAMFAMAFPIGTVR